MLFRAGVVMWLLVDLVTVWKLFTNFLNLTNDVKNVSKHRAKFSEADKLVITYIQNWKIVTATVFPLNLYATHIAASASMSNN